MALPGLYALTDARVAATHVEQVREFVEAGVRLIQIRDKTSGGQALYEAVVAALEITRPVGALLIVNDRVDVALASGADGAHVGQDDLSASAARAILGPSAVIGVSTHSVGQAIDAARMLVDYIAVGPVFATSTKENPDAVVGLEGLASVRAVVAHPLVAIGGITLESAPSVYAAGADSLAVVNDLRAGDSIANRIRAYITLCPSRS